ncbi:hypothetical protein C0971_10710 [Bacillus methanolicus]|uniref:hypothetical protein n=1 Tax=Bacillus methanolicus TaxID=1471 RepID=UPI002010BE68|nr:hypothetical protein [Bacillus methanolicus]UQD52427.1 hypothetical protein C0971_10710 [Bacillus methanolicus]
MKNFLIVLTIVMLVFQPSSVFADQRKVAEMLSWKEVNELLPKYSKFVAHDLETGMEFKVQRRAGNAHADVQPLTPKDTKIMKQIYNGNWSWKRRAIIIKKGKRRIAASMHGMPHGAGALENNFPGHFCIHFYGSTTHRTSNMDLSHKLMILKAADRLQAYLSSASPYDVISAYIAGFKQQDEKIVKSISLQKIEWKKILPNVENASLIHMSVMPAKDLKEELVLLVPVEVEWFVRGEGKRKYKGKIHVVRFSPYGPWKIDSISFLTENSRLYLNNIKFRVPSK